jgi:hypothetical protein
MTKQRRPLRWSAAAGGFFTGFFAGVSVVAERFRQLI